MPLRFTLLALALFCLSGCESLIDRPNSASVVFVENHIPTTYHPSRKAVSALLRERGLQAAVWPDKGRWRVMVDVTRGTNGQPDELRIVSIDPNTVWQRIGSRDSDYSRHPSLSLTESVIEATKNR